MEPRTAGGKDRQGQRRRKHAGGLTAMALFSAHSAPLTLARPASRPIRWSQIATGAIAISALALFALIVGRSQSIQWSEIPHYLVHPSILSGVLLTLELTAGAMLFGIVLGCLLALMATS